MREEPVSGVNPVPIEVSYDGVVGFISESLGDASTGTVYVALTRDALRWKASEELLLSAIGGLLDEGDADDEFTGVDVDGSPPAGVRVRPQAL